MALEEYKDIVGTFAMYTTMAHMLSGILICKDIIKKGTAQGFDPMPFLGGIGLCILMLRYALMLNDSTMINVNVFGLVINVFCMIVYYCYVPDTRKLLKLIYKVTGFVICFLVYAQIEHPTNVEFRFGLILTVLFFLLVGGPLVHVKEVIRTKSTEILPFPLIFMGTLVTFLWLLYGFTIGNVFVIFQNAVGFILTIAQLSLFVIFPSKKSQIKLLSGEKKED